ncbi:MAG TPA: hypothetical protein VFO45_04825 [Sphingomicrobium sp.]|nr:hypothetical protein [Sphingomicrobium sp.]
MGRQHCWRMNGPASSGLGLTLLGLLASWSFWFRKATKHRRPEIASAGLEVAAAS